MNTKLTLRLEQSLIERAKAYAKREGKSVSQIVADFFNAIDSKSVKKKGNQKLGPISKQLYGAIKDNSIPQNSYQEHLERKYL